jgi:hypothetical protein
LHPPGKDTNATKFAIHRRHPPPTALTPLSSERSERGRGAGGEVLTDSP